MPRTIALAALLVGALSPAPAEQPAPASTSTAPPAGQAKPAPTEKPEPTLVCPCVSAGNPEVAPYLWQRTWGIVGMTGFPVGEKMAPNGVSYDPLFSIDVLLNIALTADRSWYLFGTSRFWTQKAGEGITNGKQGSFDFSKRQFDIDAGLAWNYLGPWEGRILFYSDNNINRGWSLDRPAGFNDGTAIENRYYFASTNFDKGLYRFVSLGYCFTKDLVGGDGLLFKPSLYARANLALDLLPEELYIFADVELITERPLRAKLLWSDLGVAARPFRACPDLEFRVGAETTSDLDVGNTRSLLYGHVRIIW